MATDDEILARLIAKGAESRGGASEARAGGMESLQEAMAAGQPTSQDAWTTAIAGALPALLGGLFGGKAGLRAGAEGGLVGAGTSMKLGADERARKEKYGALTAKTKLDQAKELDKDARLYDMEASKGGLQSAMQDERIESSEGIAKMQEGGRWGRHAESMALRKELADLANEKDEKARREKEISIKTTLRKEFSSQAKEWKLASGISAVDDLETLVNQKTAISDGQIASKLVRLSGEVGVATEGDILRSAPFPLSTRVQKAINWTFGDHKGPVPELYREDIISLTKVFKSHYQKKARIIANSMKDNYRDSPELFSSIDSVASPYDGTGRTDKASPPTPSYSLEEIRAEKARRAAGGN